MPSTAIRPYGQRDDQVPDTWNVPVYGLPSRKSVLKRERPGAPAFWCDIGSSSPPLQVLYQSHTISLILIC
jgi:hypothetical protein